MVLDIQKVLTAVLGLAVALGLDGCVADLITG
jgi:hypothetical protein